MVLAWRGSRLSSEPQACVFRFKVCDDFFIVEFLCREILQPMRTCSPRSTLPLKGHQRLLSQDRVDYQVASFPGLYRI